MNTASEAELGKAGMEKAANKAAQEEELAVLESIYGGNFSAVEDGRQCELRVVAPDGASSSGSDSLPAVQLRVHLPDEYPAACPPVAELEAPWLQAEVRQRVWQGLQSLAEEDPGEVIIFKWAEWLKEQEWLWKEGYHWEEQRQVTQSTKDELVQWRNDEHLAEQLQSQWLDDAGLSSETPGEARSSRGRFAKGPSDESALEALDTALAIVHGAPFTEKRSTFQAHLAPVESVDGVEAVMEALLRNRKIAAATHNIMAYRIAVHGKGTILQDHDDDGETAAGGRLLHLLQILDVRNVVVVVSRWFGGILLGPDRFKHINNAARAALDTCGYISQTAKPKSRKK